MLPDTHPILVAFVDILKKREVPPTHFGYYTKWLRYFLDFCEKHPQIHGQAEQIEQYLEKLRSRQQSPQYCRQAAHAVSLYFEMCKGAGNPNAMPKEPDDGPSAPVSTTPRHVRPSQYSPAGYEEKTDSPEWDEVLAKLAAEIKVRHWREGTFLTF